MQGCVQVYTGDGRGKTTAAPRLALRMAGGRSDLVTEMLAVSHSMERGVPVRKGIEY